MTNTNTADSQFAETASTGGTVKDENLTIRGHIDPDKHWIGESLPNPSDAETTYSGISTGAGASPFPARADHSHDFRTTYCSVTPAFPYFVVCPPGSTYINNLVHYLGRNLFAPGSNQLLQFPSPGVWQVFMNYYFAREGGGFFSGEYNIAAVYNNATYTRYLIRQSLFDIPHDVGGFVMDMAHYASVDHTTNVQLRVDHNDVVNWHFTANYIEIRRLHAIGSA